MSGGERNGGGGNARVNGYFNAFKIYNAIYETTLSQNRAVIFACLLPFKIAYYIVNFSYITWVIFPM